MDYNPLPHNHGHLSEELRLEMPKPETFETVSELMKMMSDGKRIQIFWLLCHCEECVINISDGLRHNIPGSQSFEVIAEIFKILSDAKRAQLFWILCHCEECVINLSALIELSSSAVSHHLKLLKTTGFIVSRRAGKEVYYTAAKTTRVQVLHKMIEQIVEVACPADVTLTGTHIHTDDSSIQTINEVHELLTSDLTRRYTIEELSSKFHINQTTLKTTFKMVFGQSIGGYMKEYRIKQAKKLLCQSDACVAEIACAVGYENQSKFTAAFRSITGVVPRNYRKAHTKE